MISLVRDSYEFLDFTYFFNILDRMNNYVNFDIMVCIGLNFSVIRSVLYMRNIGKVSALGFLKKYHDLSL